MWVIGGSHRATLVDPAYVTTKQTSFLLLLSLTCFFFFKVLSGTQIYYTNPVYAENKLGGNKMLIYEIN